MHRLAAPLLGLSALLLAAPGAAQTKLRYKYKAGDKKSFVMEQKMTSRTNVKGMDVGSKMTMTIDMTYEVKKVDDDGKAQMELRFDRVRMDLETPIGVFELDSDDKNEAKGKAEKLFQSIIRAMGAAKMTLTKDPLGKVSDVQVPEEVLKKFREAEGAGGATGFDENTLTAMAEGSLVLPEGEVAKGKSWNHTVKAELPVGKLNSEMLYTYEGEEERDGRKVAAFTVAPKLQIEPGDKGEVKVTLKEASGKGKAYFDTEAGNLVEQTMEVTMEMEVQVGGMTLMQHVVQNTTVRLKK